MQKTVALLLLAINMMGASVLVAAEKSKSDQAFEWLASLVGEWKGEHNGVQVKLIYTMTADGSALMEEFRPSKGPVMITVFTVDGHHLLATHYCSAKNQPHMQTAPITEIGTSLKFSLIRVTGMKTPEDWHNTGLAITRPDPDHLIQEWTYAHKGTTGKTIFHFTRER